MPPDRTVYPWNNEITYVASAGPLVAVAAPVHRSARKFLQLRALMFCMVYYFLRATVPSGLELLSGGRALSRALSEKSSICR